MNNKKIMSKVIASSLVLALGTINAVPVFAYSKDETVYTKANANGSSYQTIVSEHLKNSDNAELLKDMSTLLNIKNTNGDEEASQNGTSLEWKTSGNDIYYQSKPELEFIKTCEENNVVIENGPTITYTLKNKKHIYHIDFIVNNYLIVEIKSSHHFYYETLKSGEVSAKNTAAIKFAVSNNKKFLFLLDKTKKDYTKIIKEEFNLWHAK